MEPLPAAVKDFIAAARVCRIATVRADGEPHVIPVCPVFHGETVFIDIGRKYGTAEGVHASGKVALLIDQYDDDWSRLKAVLLKCTAEPVEAEAQEAAWTMIREKFPQYSSVGWNPRLTLALRIYDWRQWGITSPP
jgi:nitroimidazol reductase NimA-like FMN-containing flavoprotein (pyridoxamine 5'-phosphate oxidase superfamily)